MENYSRQVFITSRVPVDMGSTPSSGISAVAYSRLVDYLGFEGERVRVYDVVQQLAQPSERVLDWFGADVVDLGRVFNQSEEDWWDLELPGGLAVQFPSWFRPRAGKDGSWEALDRDGRVLAVMPEGAAFFDQVYFPYLEGYPDNYRDLPAAMAKVMWAAFPTSPWDKAGEKDFWKRLREGALRLRASTDRAIMVGAGCNLFEWGTFLRRMDNFLMDLVEQPDKVEGLLDALMEIHLEGLAKLCEAVGDIADFVRFGDDLGMDSGPLMSPRIYRRLFKPRHTLLCDYVKKHSRMRPFLHSCGSIYKLIPDLIEAGFEVLNPVQIGAKGMDPAVLKKEFGKDLIFWGGGCDTKRILNRARPQEVKDHVKALLDIWMPGGGYVFNTVHNILPDVPPENIEAMMEAVREF